MSTANLKTSANQKSNENISDSNINEKAAAAADIKMKTIHK